MKEIMKNIRRNIVWVMLAALSVLLVSPAVEELNTILLIVLIEALAIALSGAALYSYSKIDFTKDLKLSGTNPGLIFLGVHICTGLVVLGVYIAQFTN